jgi:hypothetical protein
VRARGGGIAVDAPARCRYEITEQNRAAFVAPKGETMDTNTAQPIDNRKAIVDQKRKIAGRGMIIGALWCVGGIVATIVSEAMAKPGGTTFIFWGAVLFGGFRFIMSAIAYFTAKA